MLTIYRYHESLQNLTPADVYYGRGDLILSERKRIKNACIEERRFAYQSSKLKEKEKIN
jgi:putative transposase